MSLWTSFLIAFSVLLPLINPVGSSLVFLGLVGEQPSKVFRSLARRIAINNIIFLAIIELLGAAILKFFGISLPIVQLAGGIVIAVMGWGVLNERGPGANTRNKEEERGPRNETEMQYLEERIFYPFTFPITSGPGTLVGLLTLTAHISDQILVQNVLAHVGVFLAVVVITVLCYFCYAYAPKVSKAIPPSSDQEVLMEFYMKQLTVEEAKGGIVMSRKAQIAVYPVLEWFDDLGIYHDLTLFGSDVDWLSEMKVSIDDLRTRDRHKRQVSLGTRR